jgi:hypothetical protein
VRNPVLRQATIWAIQPGTTLPWLGPMGSNSLVDLVYEAYVHELGDRLNSVSQELVKRIMAGTAGNVPDWGYKLLARHAEESLAVFTSALEDKELATRERAAVALGYMGRAAAPAKSQVAQALKASEDEREQRLLQWCLRQLE